MGLLQKRLLIRLHEHCENGTSEALPYALLKLAEVMGVPVAEPILQTPLPATTRDVFLSDKSNRVDYLIEVAKLLELQRQTEFALDVLGQAKQIALNKNMTGRRLTIIERHISKFKERLQVK